MKSWESCLRISLLAKVVNSLLFWPCNSLLELAGERMNCASKNIENFTLISSLMICSALPGDEDEQFEEEKELIIAEIERVAQLSNFWYKLTSPSCVCSEILFLNFHALQWSSDKFSKKREKQCIEYNAFNALAGSWVYQEMYALVIFVELKEKNKKSFDTRVVKELKNYVKMVALAWFIKHLQIGEFYTYMVLVTWDWLPHLSFENMILRSSHWLPLHVHGTGMMTWRCSELF